MSVLKIIKDSAGFKIASLSSVVIRGNKTPLSVELISNIADSSGAPDSIEIFTPCAIDVILSNNINKVEIIFLFFILIFIRYMYQSYTEKSILTIVLI